MKFYITLIALSLMILSACTSQYQSRNYDDVYYSGKEKKADDHAFIVKPNKVESEQSPSAQSTENQSTGVDASGVSSDQPSAVNGEENASPESDTYVNNNYFLDDYYDYAYSSRLRRFHNNYFYNSYYSDYYSNPYWYDYSPWSWGLSFNFGYPYYSPWYYPGNSWGYGYYDWWDPYPYYGWGGGYGYYNSYWNGYYDGYWNGYYGGYWSENGNHHNSRYYGHRSGVGSSGSLASGTRGTRSGSTNDDKGIQQRGMSERNNTLYTSSGSRNNTSGDQDGNKRSGGRLTADPNTINGQNTRTDNSELAGNELQRPTRYVYQRTQGNKTVQPGQNTRSQGNIQPYSSPTYTKPRSGQEYTAPKYRNSGTPIENPNNMSRQSPGNTYQPSGHQENRGNSTPSVNYRTTEPSNNGGRSIENRSTPTKTYNSNSHRSTEYSSPSRNNNSYSAPSRSNDSYTPSRSSNSYSAPKSSGGSSSSPSRSSGSSSGSGSGSGHRK